MSKVIDFFKDYELSNKIDGKLLYNQSLAKFSWLGVGGIAEVYYLCESFQQLEEILTSLPKECERTVIGQGSNILIRDGGIKGLVIKLGKNKLELSIFVLLIYSLLLKKLTICVDCLFSLFFST